MSNNRDVEQVVCRTIGMSNNWHVELMGVEQMVCRTVAATLVRQAISSTIFELLVCRTTATSNYCVPPIAEVLDKWLSRKI